MGAPDRCGRDPHTVRLIMRRDAQVGCCAAIAFAMIMTITVGLPEDFAQEGVFNEEEITAALQELDWPHETVLGQLLELVQRAQGKREQNSAQESSR